MKIILFAIMVMVLFVTGCVDDNKLAGNTYKGPDGDLITFFDDGTMHYVSAGGSGESLGTYKIENGRVYFTAGFWSWSADIMDDELIDDDDVYTKIMPGTSRR